MQQRRTRHGVRVVSFSDIPKVTPLTFPLIKGGMRGVRKKPRSPGSLRDENERKKCALSLFHILRRVAIFIASIMLEGFARPFQAMS